MSATLFISDLHLESTHSKIFIRFGQFLQEQAGKCSALYILGDLFETWLGDDDNSELALSTCRHLSEFSQSSSQLYIMVGNRDFLLGEGFCQRVGAILLRDPTLIDLYGEPTLLMHGDSLCIDDGEYQTFRALTRAAKWQSEILSKPLDERRQLAAELRKLSRDATEKKAGDIMDVNLEEVSKVMAAHQVNQLIHGHTHRPQEHQHGAKTRWVLGDWEKQAWAIEATAESTRLFKFPL